MHYEARIQPRCCPVCEARAERKAKVIGNTKLAVREMARAVFQVGTTVGTVWAYLNGYVTL